jgi:hypothetical protein
LADSYSLVTRAGAFAVALSLFAPVAALAQAAGGGSSPASKRATAVRVPAGSIAVDGRLDEAVWQQAVPADGFVQQQPREGAPASDNHRSEVRFLYDDENLYIGATFHEDEPGRLVTNELKRDFNARDGDLYVVVLDTFLDKLNAYNFQTNPGCALRDSQSYDDGRTINANWDTVWFCRSSVEGTTWYVEEAVPFKQLRFPRQDEQVWGMNVFRLIRHSNEQTIWNPVPRQFNQFKMSYAGTLDGIRGVRPGRDIRFKPFVRGQTQRAGGTTTSDGDAGFDLKVGLGTNLVLDGTFRTDFSQVEADAQQVNLTRFSLFFPEKRQFFLENQGAFQIGPPATNSSNLVPFFSRTIGLEGGTPIPIVGGVRLTGKVGRNSLALLNIQTEQEDRANLASLPGSNFTVLRYGREFLRNSTAGVFYLGKERGDLSNRLVGTDLRFYPTREWNIDGMFVRSEKTGSDSGAAWRTGAQYNSGRTQATVSYTSLGDTFHDDLGFIPRQGVDITNVSLLRRLRPRSLARIFREIRPELPYNRYTRDAPNPLTGGAIGVETQTIQPTLTFEFPDASTAAYQFLNDEEFLSAPFRPQGIPSGQFIPAGRYTFHTQTVSYNGSNSRRLAFDGEYRSGEFYNGARKGITAAGRVRVSQKLAATLSVSRDAIDLPNAVSFNTTLSSLRVDASFSTRMFLNAFIQYNSVTRQVSSNIRYDFIHHPLSDIYLVYNDTHFVDITRPTPAQEPSRTLILKVTHLLSF